MRGTAAATRGEEGDARDGTAPLTLVALDVSAPVTLAARSSAPSFYTAMVPPATVSVAKENRWYYLDARDTEQGPFTEVQMRAWWDGGFLKPSLRVRQVGEEEGAFSSIETRQCAFTKPPPPPPPPAASLLPTPMLQQPLLHSAAYAQQPYAASPAVAAPYGHPYASAPAQPHTYPAHGAYAAATAGGYGYPYGAPPPPPPPHPSHAYAQSAAFSAHHGHGGHVPGAPYGDQRHAQTNYQQQDPYRPRY